MATNLGIDETLIEKAVKLGNHRTKREAVNDALREYVDRRSQASLIQLFGKVEYRDDYDYKKLRTRRKRAS